MTHVISVGQVYRHRDGDDDGDDYEVIKADRDGVFFETSSGSVVYMEHDEVVTALNECVLLPVVDLDDDVEEENEDEDEDSGD